MNKRYKFYAINDEKKEAIGTTEATTLVEAVVLFAKRKLLSVKVFKSLFFCAPLDK